MFDSAVIIPGIVRADTACVDLSWAFFAILLDGRTTAKDAHKAGKICLASVNRCGVGFHGARYDGGRSPFPSWRQACPLPSGRIGFAWSYDGAAC